MSSFNGKPLILPLALFSLGLLTLGTTFSSGELQFSEMLESSGVSYRNVSGEPEKRFILSSLGSGAGLFDYDEDGDLDLYLINGAILDGVRVIPAGTNRLYRNEGGWSFRDVTEESGAGDSGWGLGCAVGDYDNDGWSDLYVSNVGANVLLRNQGDGTFRDVSGEAGVGHDGWGTSSAFFDADHDGDLDLYVANYMDPDPSKLPLPGTLPTCRWFGLEVFCGPRGLNAAPDVYYRNEGNGSFSDATEEFGFDVGSAYGLGVVAGDYDSDGDVDLYVANDSVPNFLFRNNGDGHFADVGLLSGAAYNASGQAEAGMGVDLVDLDGDGQLEIFVTNFANETNTFYSNRGGIFLDATSETNLEMLSLSWLGWATRFADWDNDGDDDLFVANGHVYPQIEDAARAESTPGYRQQNQIFINQGRGEFAEATFSPGDGMRAIASSRGGAFGDIDNDGDIDAVILNIDDTPSLLRNDTAAQGRWIGLRLVGTSGNREGIGARVVLTRGSQRQIKEVHPSGSFLSSSDSRLYFGMGVSEVADSIRIRWPNGLEQQLDGVSSNQLLLVVEGREPYTLSGVNTRDLTNLARQTPGASSARTP